MHNAGFVYPATLLPNCMRNVLRSQVWRIGTGALGGYVVCSSDCPWFHPTPWLKHLFPQWLGTLVVNIFQLSSSWGLALGCREQPGSSSYPFPGTGCIQWLWETGSSLLAILGPSAPGISWGLCWGCTAVQPFPPTDDPDSTLQYTFHKQISILESDFWGVQSTIVSEVRQNG